MPTPGEQSSEVNVDTMLFRREQRSARNHPQSSTCALFGWSITARPNSCELRCRGLAPKGWFRWHIGHARQRHRPAVPIQVQHGLLPAEPFCGAVYNADDRLDVHYESNRRRVDDPRLYFLYLGSRLGRRFPAVGNAVPEPVGLVQCTVGKLRPVKLDVANPTLAFRRRAPHTTRAGCGWATCAVTCRPRM
jgi:hypothetical protein